MTAGAHPTARGGSLAILTTSLWLFCAGCAPKPEPPTVGSDAPGFVVGDSVTLTAAQQAYVNSVPSLKTKAGLETLFREETLRDEAAVRRTIIGIFKGIESAEMGLVVYAIILDRLAAADGHSPEEKRAWNDFADEGALLLLQHISETIRRIMEEMSKLDMSNPEFEVLTTVDGRPYVCNSLPPPIHQHLQRLEAEAREAPALFADHIRWQMTQGAGATKDAREMLMLTLLGSRIIVRNDPTGVRDDICILMERYLSPEYEQSIRKSITNPLAAYGVQGEIPGMREHYQDIIRSGWEKFWERFSFLSGISGIGAMLGLLIAGSVLRRRRGRRARAEQEVLSAALNQKQQAAAAAETADEVRAATTESVELLKALLDPKRDGFWSKTRFRRRGEGLAFYLPITLLGMTVGAIIESSWTSSGPHNVPLIAPSLRPTNAAEIGLAHVDAQDFDSYPESVATLLQELAKPEK